MKKIASILKFFSMESQLKPTHPKELQTCVSLRQLVNQVMIDKLPRPLQQKCIIVNAVEKEIRVNNENNILASVICRLLSTTILYTNDNCIRVTANISGDVTWLNITTNDTRHDWAIANSLRQVKSMTEKIGGCATVFNNKLSGITLAFTFRNQELAAGY